MKPIFAANHHWAMDQGERSLKLELARRHAAWPNHRFASAGVRGGAGTGVCATAAAVKTECYNSPGADQ
jgi:hypothetical protein